MKLFKLTAVTTAVLSLAGCITPPTAPDGQYKTALDPAYVELLIEKAKAEERARVMAELASQNKDDKRFSDIKIRQLESQVDKMMESRTQQIADENSMTYDQWQASQQAQPQKSAAHRVTYGQDEPEEKLPARSPSAIAQDAEPMTASVPLNTPTSSESLVQEPSVPVEPVQVVEAVEAAPVEPVVQEPVQQAYQAPVQEVVEPEPQVIEPVSQPQVATQYKMPETPQRYTPGDSASLKPYEEPKKSPRRVYSVMDNVGPISSNKVEPEVSSPRPSYSVMDSVRAIRQTAPTAQSTYSAPVEQAYTAPEIVPEPAEPSRVQPAKTQSAPTLEQNQVSVVNAEPAYNDMNSAGKGEEVATYAVAEQSTPPVDIEKLNQIRAALNKPLLPDPYKDSVATAEPVVEPVTESVVAKQPVLDTPIKQCYTLQTVPHPYNGSLREVKDMTGEQMKLPALCKSSRTPEVVEHLQRALSKEGFLKPSPPNDLEVIDGIWGTNTLQSLIAFQKAKGLAYGSVSIESLEVLGVIPKSRVNSAPVVAPASPTETIVTEHKVVAPAARSGVVFSIEKTTVPLSQEGVRRCYVNQVIPANYRGTMPEVLEQNDTRVGNKQKLPTLCKASRSRVIIGRLQMLLHEQGYLKPFTEGGEIIIDGMWGVNTLAAVRDYQRDNGLAYGQLSMEMLEHIGVFQPK